MIFGLKRPNVWVSERCVYVISRKVALDVEYTNKIEKKKTKLQQTNKMTMTMTITTTTKKKYQRGPLKCIVCASFFIRIVAGALMRHFLLANINRWTALGATAIATAVVNSCEFELTCPEAPPTLLMLMHLTNIIMEIMHNVT